MCNGDSDCDCNFQPDNGPDDCPHDNDGENSNVVVNNNHIYFYAEVTRFTILQLTMAIQDLNTDFACRQKALNVVSNDIIYLHINSDGGSLFDGLAAVDCIKKSKVPIYAIVDGSCASAASLMLVVAKKRLMNENSFVLIHQLSSGAWGTFSNIQDSMQNCTIFMETIKKIYLKCTKITEKKLDQILSRDLWFSAEQCKKLNIIDEII
jgi:ATP-dependent protease ClpP protease subunit